MNTSMKLTISVSIAVLCLSACSSSSPSIEGTWERSCDTEENECNGDHALVAGISLHNETGAQCSVTVSNVTDASADVTATCAYYAGQVFPGHTCSGTATPLESNPNLWSIAGVECTVSADMSERTAPCKTPSGDAHLQFEMSTEGDSRNMSLFMRVPHPNECDGTNASLAGQETNYMADLPLVGGGSE